MTQKQAWLKIAKGFQNDEFNSGICCQIGNLYNTGLLTNAVWKRMCKKINSYKDKSPAHCKLYLYPVKPCLVETNIFWDGRYSQFRADICRRFANGRKPTYNYVYSPAISN